MAENRQNARRTFILPLPWNKVRKRQDRCSVVAVGTDGHSIFDVGRTAAAPRDDVVNVKHVRQVVLADTANVVLPSCDSSALGFAEQPPWIPAAAAQRDLRSTIRLVRSLCRFAGALIAAVDDVQGVLPTPQRSITCSSYYLRRPIEGCATSSLHDAAFAQIARRRN